MRIHEDYFINEAEVGDLILCQTKKGKMKMVSAAVPDQIGIIVKLRDDNLQDKDEVFILKVGQSINRPIILQSWREFRVLKYQMYTDCWYRHLYCDRNPEWMLKVQYFIQKIRENPLIDVKEIGDKERMYSDTSS